MFFDSPKRTDPANSEEKESFLKLFDKYGGRMRQRDLEDHLNRIPFQDYEREYVKAVMAKFDNPHEPGNNRYVTKEEFLQGLQEMVQNNRDSITPDEVERIKEYFSR